MKKSTIKKLAVSTITAAIFATAAMPTFAATQMGYKDIAGNNASAYTSVGSAEYASMAYTHISGGSIDFKLKQQFKGIWFTDLTRTLSSTGSYRAYGSSFETSHNWEASAYTSKTYAKGNVSLYKER